MDLLLWVFIAAFFAAGLCGLYCIYDIGRIRDRWEKDGVDEVELRKDFYK